MTTIKEQVLTAMKHTGESPDSLICFYQPVTEEDLYSGWNRDRLPEPIKCSFNELPEREYNSGFGGPEGEPFIGFTDKYIYINCQYDGSEWITHIPRHPRFVTKPIPWPGG